MSDRPSPEQWVALADRPAIDPGLRWFAFRIRADREPFHLFYLQAENETMGRILVRGHYRRHHPTTALRPHWVVTEGLVCGAYTIIGHWEKKD